MAKKKKNKSFYSHNTDVVKFCAFWGIVIAAVAALVSFVIAILGKNGVQINGAGTFISVCNTISQIALTIAAIIPAYKYSRGKSLLLKLIFWAAVAFIICGLVGINIAF